MSPSSRSVFGALTGRTTVPLRYPGRGGGGVSHLVETTAFLQVADGDYKRYRYIGGSGKEVLAQ